MIEYTSGVGDMLTDVLVGLSKSQKTISPKYLYDEKGSQIFEQICSLPEYYPTRAENEILHVYADEIAEKIGVNALIFEPGSGCGEKSRRLLRGLKSPVAYVPIEISRETLIKMTDDIYHEFPSLKVIPVCADFAQNFRLPPTTEVEASKKIVFFPGSTIGNFTPEEAVSFLRKFSALIGSGGGLLIGVDLKKGPDILNVAYDDSQGVTASFNLNLLTRINRELDAAFEVENFTHEAFYNESQGRVEMHIKSKFSQAVRVNQTVFRFKAGETIHTESSYKYSVEEFCELCAKAKLTLKQCWKDSKELFCVYYFEKE